MKPDRGRIGPDRTGLVCIVPLTLAHLYADAELVISPLTIVGAVLLTVGLVRRGRYLADEPVLPSPEERSTASAPSLPPPPTPVDGTSPEEM